MFQLLLSNKENRDKTAPWRWHSCAFFVILPLAYFDFPSFSLLWDLKDPHNTTVFHGFAFMGFRRLFGHMPRVTRAGEKEQGGLIAAG